MDPRMLELTEKAAKQKTELLKTRGNVRGRVVVYKLADGNLYTPDSPVTVPVDVRPNDEPRLRLTFECDASVPGWVTVVLPSGIVKGGNVIAVNHSCPQTVKIRRGAPRNVPIPYAIYFDERTASEVAGDKAADRVTHGFAESNSPPAMQIGP